MTLKPIQKTVTLKDQAYESIKQAIYSNTLLPGTPLTEEQLSSMLSISRTPIRSALQQLVFEKLATTDSTGHIFVSSVTHKDVEDITIMRMTLEPMALDMTSFPIFEGDLEVLESYYIQQYELFNSSPDDNVIYQELDTKFHAALSALCGNKYLYETIQNINNVMERINILSGTLHENKRTALQEHKAILDFIKNNQKEFAKVALTEHIKNVCSRMLPDDSI